MLPRLFAKLEFNRGLAADSFVNHCNRLCRASCLHSLACVAIRFSIFIRKANLDDREAIERLIIESARNLSREDYSEQQIEAAILTVFGVDTDLILDGTYFVADSFGKLISIWIFAIRNYISHTYNL